MKRIYALVVACCVSLPASAFAQCGGADLRNSYSEAARADLAGRVATIPYGQGNHWRAVRGAQTVHVIGTLHVDDPRMDAITARLAGVVEASGVLLTEVTAVEEEALETTLTTQPEIAFLQDQTLIELMSEDDWQRLLAELSARGIPGVIASRMQPWYVSVLLGLPPCLAPEMAAARRGLDHRLMDIAVKAGVVQRALEPFDTLVRLFAEDPLDVQVEWMMLGLDTQAQSEDMLATLRAAYFEQAHAEAWELSRDQVMAIDGETPERLAEIFGEMEADLLVRRNVAWIPVILSALEGQSLITVAAGAAHLSGTQGVLALLEAEGFVLERLPF